MIRCFFWKVGLVIVLFFDGFACRSAIADPPSSGTYVSARAYWHYMRAAQWWSNSNSKAGMESLRLALVYDPKSSAIRSRWAQLQWASSSNMSKKKLRQLIQLSPKDFRLYRLLGLEHWRQGQPSAALKSFRRALRLVCGQQDTDKKTIVRDMAFLLASENAMNRAFSVLKIHGPKDRQLIAVKRSLLQYRVKTSAKLCTSEDDGAHKCDEGWAFGPKASDKKSLMNWKKSIEWGIRAMHWSSRCPDRNSTHDCALFDRALRHLAQPLAYLERADVN